MNQELNNTTKEWLSKTTNLDNILVCCLFCEFFDIENRKCKKEHEIGPLGSEAIQKCGDWRVYE